MKNNTELQNNTRASTPPDKKGGCLRGCLIIILGFLGLTFLGAIIVAIGMSTNPDKWKSSTERTTAAPKSELTKYIDLSDEQATNLETILNECGIEKIKTIEHDELLDNAHADGETGYRVTAEGIDNIILYLFSDKSVSQIRYADYDLYANDGVIATLQDYTISKDELDKYQYLCKEKVKEILKSPSTAKFPNYTEWGFKQEKNIFTVQGYVDAQNSFGVETRSKFQFIIDTNSDTIQSFIFDGQELIK